MPPTPDLALRFLLQDSNARSTVLTYTPERCAEDLRALARHHVTRLYPVGTYCEANVKLFPALDFALQFVSNPDAVAHAPSGFGGPDGMRFLMGRFRRAVSAGVNDPVFRRHWQKFDASHSWPIDSAPPERPVSASVEWAASPKTLLADLPPSGSCSRRQLEV